MAKLPGVTGAQLNPTAGKLVIDGAFDLDAIRAEGRKESYTIREVGEPEPTEKQGVRVDWELWRTVGAGLLLAAGFVAEKAGASQLIYLPLYLGAIVLGGFGNFRKAFHSLPKLDFNMSVLMSAAMLGAGAIGAWEEAAFVAFLFSVSEMLESWTMDRARRSIGDLINAVPKTARVQREVGVVEVPVEEILVGDLMVVRPSEMLAMDGEVVEGTSSLDEATITGESVPVDKTPGCEVYAGTVNGGGLLVVRVTRLVGDTTVAKIVHMVEEAQTKRAPSQAFVERFAAVYTPIVLSLAAAIVLIPPIFFHQPWEPWFYRGLALLIVSCPCALVVSTPVAVVSAISNAARRGVLVKGGVYLEQMGSVRAIAFDKTGTLTEGRPVVTDVITLNGTAEDQLLGIAASLETGSEHPLARAVVAEARRRSVRLSPVSDLQALAGLGVSGTVDGQRVVAGSSRLLASALASSEASRTVQELHDGGKTVVIVEHDDIAIGVIGIADAIRPTTKDTLAQLREAGIAHTVMLTGDNQAAAASVARQAGLEDFQAELLPEGKVEATTQLMERFGSVAMVGDGVNDAPALATATVGIAMGGAGTDAALETADIALMADDLTQLPFLVRLSRASLGTIKFNIAFAIAIKLVAVLLVFPGWLTLWLAILSDMGATILVSLNGIRLLRWDK